VCALGLLAAACGDDDDGESRGTTTTGGQTATSGSGTSAPADEGCTPDREGGEVTMSAFLLTRSMDPVVSFGTASTGAIELAAMYDTLMRWNAEEARFEPRLAESLEPNADFTEWTLTLRPDVTFGNGDPFTTAAVKASIERHIDPANQSTSRVDASAIEQMELIDDRHMVFHLREPWGTFPFLLSDNTGLITNPDVVEAMGKEAFGLSPVGAGAGPYELVRFSPTEEILFEARDDYWGGLVCIKRLRFIDIPLEDSTYDALKLGEIDIMWSQDPVTVAKAKDEGFGVFEELSHTGGFIMINNGIRNTTPDTRDVRVRQAIAHAIDAEEINRRLYDGKGLPSTSIIHESSPFWPGVEGPRFDPDEARRLVAEAKAAGWDGTLSLVCSNTNPDIPVTIEGMLEAVGMDVDLQLVPTNEMVQRVNVEGSYEANCSGGATFDASPVVGLNRWYGPQNFFTGFNDPEFNQGLTQLRQAASVEDSREALGVLQEVWNEKVPSVIYSAVPWTRIWNPRVKGLTFNALGGMYFSDAYVED